MTNQHIKNKIKFYQDFPKKGISFIDLLPLLGDAKAFSEVIRELAAMVSSPNVAAPEARGFIFAAPLLAIPDNHINSLAVFRKPGKLPFNDGDLVTVPIVKEYGSDNICFRKSDFEPMATVDGLDYIPVTVLDDVLATGGTAEAMALQINTLSRQCNNKTIPFRVTEFVFLAEIVDINARQRLQKIAPVKSLLTF